MPEGNPQQLVAAISRRGRPPGLQLVAGSRGWQQLVGTGAEKGRRTEAAVTGNQRGAARVCGDVLAKKKQEGGWFKSRAF